MTLSKRQRRARKERERAQKACRCRGKSGAPKVLYATREKAVAVGMHGRGPSRVYPCPTGTGWHTTHAKAVAPYTDEALYGNTNPKEFPGV